MRRKRSAGMCFLMLLAVCTVVAGEPQEPALGQQPALLEPELSAEEVKTFMHEMARYVEEHHLKADSDSPQVGMVYEYFDTTQAGKPGQWVQGEALDTMHDGAWYAAAMVQAHRATRDPYYLEFLKKYQIPFYTNILNHSDVLFQDGSDPAKVARTQNQFGTTHRYLGEKGFCPYFWDDGASVSIEAHWHRTGQHPYECVDYYLLEGAANPDFRLKGFSMGCSNHMAQDLAVMLMQTWLATRDERLAQAALHLHRSRTRRGYAIPMNVAAAGLTNRDAELLASAPAVTQWEPRNHYVEYLHGYQPDQPRYAPVFTDDQEYVYYYSIAREGGRMSRALAIRTIYDAFTLPWLFHYWSDTEAVPAGMNRAEQAPIQYVNGRPKQYRSDHPWPMGSRMGPQNMVVCGWALQAVRAYPGIWEDRYREQFAGDLLVRFVDEAPAIDGRIEATYSEAVKSAGVEVRLAGDRHQLYLAGSAPGEAAEIVVFAQPDAAGRQAVLQLQKDGQTRATSGAGSPLVHTARITPAEAGFQFEVSLSYTVAKGQAEWATGVEHGRYSIRAGQATRNCYLMSTEDQVRRALWRELTVGLRNWREVFRQRGYVPTSFGGRLGHLEADKISETGGYAHLITAAAQYLFCLEGKSDWQEERIPGVE